METLNRFNHLRGVARGAAERLIHRRELGPHGFAASATHGHHRPSERQGVFLAFHEGPFAKFHIEDQRVDSFRQFLAHDTGANKWDALDRAGDIPQGVKFAIRGHDLRRLANHRDANFFENGAKFGHAEHDAEAGDGFQFIERPAGVTKTSTAHHRNFEATSRRERGEDERNFITDASRGMFIYFRSRDRLKINHFTRAHHGISEPSGFLGSHSAEKNRHQECGCLVVCKTTIGYSLREEFDFGFG